MAQQVPAESAGPLNVKLSDVRKAAQKPKGESRRAMTGIEGSGAVGSDSRPGSFKASLSNIKDARPTDPLGDVKQTNRRVKTGSGRDRPLDRTDRAIASVNAGSIPDSAGTRRGISAPLNRASGQRIPLSSEIVEGRNDIGAALGRMMGRINNPVRPGRV